MFLLNTARRFNTNYVYLAASFIAAVIVALDLNILINNHGAALAGHKQIKKSASTFGSKVVPNSSQPSNQLSKYQVPPLSPKYLIIPSIGVDARIFSVGLTNQGSIATPSSIYDVAWYNGSAGPGNKGAMFIDGHISSWTADGVFFNLQKLVPGDKIEIVRGDNTTYSYAVTGSQVFSSNNVDMKKALAAIDPAKPGLNLMTCDGNVITGTSDFNERLVVYSELD